MFQGWLAVGGQEVINNERYGVSAAALGLPTPAGCRDAAGQQGCPALPVLLADAPYVHGTGVPWYDAGVPESAGFAGVYGVTVTGLDSATGTREVAPGVDDVGIVGQTRWGPRTMAFTVFLAATSEAALGYGLSWLDTVLRDDCANPCGGATVCMLADCPTVVPADSGAADAAWADLSRTLHDVVTVDGPKVVSRHELLGGVGATVEFTLVAAVPFIYRTPQEVAADLAFTAPGASSGCAVEWVPVGAGRGICPPQPVCGPPVSCLDDPWSAPLPALPAAPQVAGACITRLREGYAVADAPPNLIPRWLDSVPVVTVRPGAAEMRRLTLRIHPNPAGRTITDPADLDPCTALAEINVPYLPGGVELVVDGRSRQAWVNCPGGVVEPAESALYGPDGGPWEWPRLTCGGAVTVLLLVDGDHYDASARVDVALAAQQDVA